MSEEIQIKRRQEMARALARGGVDDSHIISYQSAHEVLTPRRREIIDTLNEETPDSVRALSRTLDRDKAAVSRDLGVLAEHNLVTYEEEGSAKRPVLVSENVVVEPVTWSKTDAE